MLGRVLQETARYLALEMHVRRPETVTDEFVDLFAGFSSFDKQDQFDIIRLGQSPSRILAGACHWYDAKEHNFKDFLSWKPKNVRREYMFKEACLNFASIVSSQNWEFMESAFMNALVMIATGMLSYKPP